MTPKEQFISEYIEKRMKNHNLHYGKVYLAVLETVKERAERMWNEYYSKQITEQ